MRPINVAFFQEKLRWFSHIVIQESFQDRQARVLEERNRATKSYEDAQLIIEASRILLDNLVWLSPQMQFLRHCLHPSSANLIALLKAPVEYIPGISNDLLEHDWTQASAGANWPKFAAQLRSILLCHRGVEFNALTVADEYRKECGTGDQAATLRALERTGRWPHLCLDGLLVEDKPEPEVPASLVQLFEVFKSSSFYTGQDADPVLTFGQVFVVASQLGVTVETQDLPGLLKRIHWGKPLLLRTSCLHSLRALHRHLLQWKGARPILKISADAGLMFEWTSCNREALSTITDVLERRRLQGEVYECWDALKIACAGTGFGLFVESDRAAMSFKEKPSED
jgi:hypothetical protein